jgi:hypothetical protein
MLSWEDHPVLKGKREPIASEGRIQAVMLVVKER